MFTNRELTSLLACKAGLLAQSAANRGAMIAAVGHLRREAVWVEAGYDFFLKARSAASVAAPAAGLFSALRGHGLAAWISRISSAVRLFLRIRSMWKAGAANEQPSTGDGI